MVKTKSINIQNLCIPCYNHCKYCLLSWSGKCLGIDYERSVRYAKAFYGWMKEEHSEIDFMYSFGYSMEHPRLMEAILFMQETGSPGGEFLQLDGMKIRSKDELQDLFEKLKDAGIKMVDFTFYGTKEYHDKFAGRQGDFELMMNSLGIALQKGIDIEVGIPVTKENLQQLEELVELFSVKTKRLFLFTPHSGGRGVHLLSSKITASDYETLGENVQKYFNRKNSRTPQEWLDNPPEEYQSRALRLSLLPENIELLEKQSLEETLNMLEEMDVTYYKQVPTFQKLLEIYADASDQHLYSKKDLNLIYSKRYIEEHQLDIQDINDERFHGSIRY